MPIAPVFALSQTDTHVIFEIRVPHIRVSQDSLQVELSDDDAVVHFASLPIYVLRLDFTPHRFQPYESELLEPDETDNGAPLPIPDVIDSRSSRSSKLLFLPLLQNGTVRLELVKLIPGVHWPNLDLIGRLTMNPSRGETSTWLHQVESDGREPTEELDAVTSSTRQAVLHEEEGGLYGFGRLFRGIFTDLNRDGVAQQMLEGPWTTDDDVPLGATNVATIRSRQQDRREKRMLYENQVFDADRYLADLLLDDSLPALPVVDRVDHRILWEQDDAGDALYISALQMQPHWTQPTVSEPYFTEPERLALASIPYPLLSSCAMIPRWGAGPSRRHDGLCIGLLDILFAYVYDHILNDGEANVESAWTISTLSASLSWLDDWLDDDGLDSAVASRDQTSNRLCHLTRQVIVSSTRRALIYPYIRTVTMARHVWHHVALVLRGRRDASDPTNVRLVVRCLLHIRTILQTSDMHYLGNKLFIDPYLAWLQQRHERVPMDDSCHVESADRCDNAMEALADAIELVVGTNEASRDSLEAFKDSLDLDLVQLEAEFFGESRESTHESSESDSSESETEEESEDEDQLEPGPMEPPDEIHEGDPKANTDTHVSRELLDMHLGDARSPLNVLGTTISDDMDGTVAALQTLSLAKTTAPSTSLIQEMD